MKSLPMQTTVLLRRRTVVLSLSLLLLLLAGLLCGCASHPAPNASAPVRASGNPLDNSGDHGRPRGAPANPGP